MKRDRGTIPAFFTQGGDKSLWEKRRRSEILALFAKELYGNTPPTQQYTTTFALLHEDTQYRNGTATKREVQATIGGPYGKFTFPFAVLIPNQGKQQYPAVVFIDNRAHYSEELAKENADGFWDVDSLLSRGWATAQFFTKDVSPDADINFVGGIIPTFCEDSAQRLSDDWATIGAWAFGASRVLDYLVIQPNIRRDRIALVGHSRGGKTALWCAAQDTRFWSAMSNDSGCAGAAIARGNVGERVADINKGFPYWFCENYKKYNGKEEDLPFDQHMLVALMAPRPVYIASATLDPWADPESEYLAARLAEEIYRLYDEVPAKPEELPPPDTPDHTGPIGYHIRTGEHNLTPFDWNAYLDFLDKHL